MSRPWTCVAKDGCRRERGDGGGFRRFSAKLCRCDDEEWECRRLEREGDRSGTAATAAATEPAAAWAAPPGFKLDAELLPLPVMALPPPRSAVGGVDESMSSAVSFLDCRVSDCL